MERLNYKHLYPLLKEIKVVTDSQHAKEDARIMETYGPLLKSRAAFWQGKPETQYYVPRNDRDPHNRDIVAILKIKR